jgi:hypothetical protein
MATLFGKNLTRLQVEERTGSLAQFAGVRLMTLEDGVERGIRSLEFRTGSGLKFNVLIDRAFDIADCEFKGQSIGWQSPTGFRNPALHEYEGEGGLAWMRSFSGLLVTCGLDHILFMNEENADHFNYGPRKTISSSLHGRVGTIPGKLLSYGEMWDGDQCTLYCEGLVVQATVFGEDLHLIRRIEVKLGTSEIHLKDRVINHGFYRTPHMLCYHINIGYPVLDEGSEYLAPIMSTPWAAHAGVDYQKQGVGYNPLPAPQTNFHEQVWQHDLAGDSKGRTTTAILNPNLNLAFSVEVDLKEFPAQFEWQNFQKGMYAIGIEPSTNHVLGKPFALERDELIWLEHNDERNYHSVFRVHEGESEIGALRNKIQGIAKQPEDAYPDVSGIYRKINNV